MVKETERNVVPNSTNGSKT